MILGPFEPYRDNYSNNISMSSATATSDAILHTH